MTTTPHHTTALLHATTTLAAIMTEENTALATLDLRHAAQLVPAKRAATDIFTAAHAHLAANRFSTTGHPDGPARAMLAIAAAQLRDLAAENRRLLDRALATQSRLLDIIAQAVPRASTQAPRYNPAGALVGCSRALPVAITASA